MACCSTTCQPQNVNGGDTLYSEFYGSTYNVFGCIPRPTILGVPPYSTFRSCVSSTSPFDQALVPGGPRIDWFPSVGCVGSVYEVRLMMVPGHYRVCTVSLSCRSMWVYRVLASTPSTPTLFLCCLPATTPATRQVISALPPLRY